MFDIIKDLLEEFCGWWRYELNRKWRIGLVVGTVAGIVLSMVVGTHKFAAEGCAIYGFGTIMATGFVGILFSIVCALSITMLLVAILYIPEGLRRAIESIREEAEYRRELKEGLKAEGAPRDWRAVKRHLCFWPAFFALVAGLAFTFGYVAWALVC